MKRKTFILNFIIAFLLVFAASAFILRKAESSIRHIIDGQRKTVRAQVGDKLKNFDLFMLVVADKMEVRAEKALTAIDAILGESAAKGIPAEPETLRRLADGLGIGEIYLVNSNGVIFSTSNRKEQGVNLIRAGKNLGEFLTDLYGRGAFAHGRLTIGMVTGRPTMFSYYSPKGSTYIVETAVYLEDFISEEHGRKVYDYYFRDFFKELTASCVYTENIDVFTKFRVSGFSLFNFRHELPIESSEAERLRDGGVLELEKNGRLYEYSAFRLKDSEGNFTETYFLEIVYNFAGAGDSVMKSAYAAIAAVGLCGVLLFFMLNCIAEKRLSAKKSKTEPEASPRTDDGAQKGEKTEREPPLPEERFGAYRVLLADDSEYNRFVTESYLEGTGCSVDYADSGFAALELFSKNRYDMVLTDIQMPRMNGYELTKEIRAFEAGTGRGRTPVIAITAYSLEHEAKRCLEAGCDAYVAKPLSRDALLQTMAVFRNGHLEKPSMPEEGEDGFIEVNVRPEFAEVTPLFLRDLKQMPQKIRELLDNDDFESIQFIGHRLKGEAKTFGFEPVSDYGLYIQGAAIRRSRQKIEETAEDLNEYASKIRLIFDKKSV
ncbi:MAG: response regulator [Deferribacterales bacterium]